MNGTKRFIAAEAAQQRGPYDEYPMLPPGIDPQVHLSRNDRPQPFYLICEHDCVLVTMTGTGRVLFPVGSVRYWDLESGDFVYVPGGTPHRIVPSEECVHLRYKAEKAGLEAVAWLCDECGHEMSRVVWDTAVELPQSAYQRACESFNTTAAARTCSECGHQHPPIDLSAFGWGRITAELASTGT